MIETIERMLTDLERSKITRRQFAVSLDTLAASSLAAPGAFAAPPAPAGFCAVSLNQITVKVPDLHRTSKFYQEFFGIPLRQQSATTHILGVGKSFFGIEQCDNEPASVNHYDFGIGNFDADSIRPKLRELNLKYSGTSQESFKFNDPDGSLVQVNRPVYVGHVLTNTEHVCPRSSLRT
jgi:hypothetical protein